MKKLRWQTTANGGKVMVCDVMDNSVDFHGIDLIVNGQIGIKLFLRKKKLSLITIYFQIQFFKAGLTATN